MLSAYNILHCSFQDTYRSRDDDKCNALIILSFFWKVKKTFCNFASHCRLFVCCWVVVSNYNKCFCLLCFEQKRVKVGKVAKRMLWRVRGPRHLGHDNITPSKNTDSHFSGKLYNVLVPISTIFPHSTYMYTRALHRILNACS